MWAFMRKFGVHYLSLPGSETIKVIDFMRTDVLNRIKETLRKVIPAGGHAFCMVRRPETRHVRIRIGVY